MLLIQLREYKNENMPKANGKFFAYPVITETKDIDDLSDHMASHNTPFSKGAIKGILTDAVVCTKELLLSGKNVKFPDLAIFSIGLKVKEGAPTKEDFTVAKYISGLKLRARATGELSSANLDTTIKRIDLAKSDSTNKDNSGSTPSTGDNNGDSGSTPTTPGGSGSTDTGEGGGVYVE